MFKTIIYEISKCDFIQVEIFRGICIYYCGTEKINMQICIIKVMFYVINFLFHLRKGRLIRNLVTLLLINSKYESKFTVGLNYLPSIFESVIFSQA